jgi:NADH-quinone oxidoreductase subunit G
VLRVLPRLHEEINEEWISDKTRHAIDGLKRQRLDTPYLRGEDGKLHPVSWEEALAQTAARLKNTSAHKIAALAGDLVDAEAMFALSDILTHLGSPHKDCRQDGAMLDADAPVSYLFNTTIAGIENADCLLLIGTNPRHEAALVNARLRKRWRQGGFPVGLIGAKADLTYPYQHLGEGSHVLTALIKALEHQEKTGFAGQILAAKRPMMIVGQAALRGANGRGILSLTRRIAELGGMVQQDEHGQIGWNGFNVLNIAAARVGGMALRFVPGPQGLSSNEIVAAARAQEIEVLYLLGADEVDLRGLERCWVIYQGHHGDVGAHHADVVLPGAAYTEKSGTYLNIEGRMQRTQGAVFPPGLAREDWKILRALAGLLAIDLGYDDLPTLRAQMAQRFPAFRGLNKPWQASWQDFGNAPVGEVSETARFTPALENFYMTCPISRASNTMAACVEAFSSAGKGDAHG